MQAYWADLNGTLTHTIPLSVQDPQPANSCTAPAAEYSQNLCFPGVAGSAIACIQPVSAAGPMLMQLAYVRSSVSRDLYPK